MLARLLPVRARFRIVPSKNGAVQTTSCQWVERETNTLASVLTGRVKAATMTVMLPSMFTTQQLEGAMELMRAHIALVSHRLISQYLVLAVVLCWLPCEAALAENGTPIASGEQKDACVEGRRDSPWDPDVVLMGMGIEKSSEDSGLFTIETPGALVTLEPEGMLRIRQRIGADRELLRLHLDAHYRPWKFGEQTPFRSVLVGNGLHITVQGDSVIIFEPQQNVKLAFEGRFPTAYHQEVRGNRLLLDSTGGCGFFGIPPRPTAFDAAADPWTVRCHLARWDQLWLSVCPPRAEDSRRRYQSISHDILYYLLKDDEMAERYPSRATLEKLAEHCQILALHEEIWRDAPAWVVDPPGANYEHPKPWETDRHLPFDEKEFARMREDAQALGLKVVAYCSPYYSNAPDIFAEMERVLNEYQLDGLYFDGWCSRRDDFRLGYDLMRRARALLGDRILYLHSSTDPFGTVQVYLPFVFAYADFCLRGEAGRAGKELDTFLRYTVSGHQISNSVGMWCYYGSTDASGYKFVVPTSAHIEAALRNHVRLWQQSRMWAGFPEELSRFQREYYGALEGLRAQP